MINHTISELGVWYVRHKEMIADITPFVRPIDADYYIAHFTWVALVQKLNGKWTTVFYQVPVKISLEEARYPDSVVPKLKNGKEEVALRQSQMEKEKRLWRYKGADRFRKVKWMSMADYSRITYGDV